MQLFRSRRPSPLDREALVEAVEALHADVDRTTARLEAMHRDRLRCGLGCSQCCVDELTVFDAEAEVIRQRASAVLAQSPHPTGACAMLDDAGACRIYAHRPYVCRTQGLPLRWLDEQDEGGGELEYRDICPLNEDGPPIESLDAASCHTLGPFEGRLAQLQVRQDGGALRRVALRDLFPINATEST